MKLTTTRRLFLRLATLGVGGAALYACGGGSTPAEAAGGPGAGAATPTPPPAPAPGPGAPPAPAPGGPAGVVIQADPSNYLAKLAALNAGDTLLLAPGNYGVDSQGNDTADAPGLPISGLNGTPSALIVITGPASGPRPVLLGRSTHNTIRLSNASFVVIRRLEVDGRGLDGFGVATQGPTHDITVEDNYFHGHGGDQQIVAISTTGYATWNWVIRRNRIVGAGTGLYLGNSTGDGPFVAGLIEHNVVVDTIGYNMQVKHQVAWPATIPAGMPTGKTTTIIRHNVFSKSAGNSATGGLARPNLLVGDCPPSGPGSTNGFAIYGNFFFQNPSESLFQGEGNIAFYDNVMVQVAGGDAAVRVQPQNGLVRDVRIFHNTVLSEAGPAIVVSGGSGGGGGSSSYTQRVLANAVFSPATPAISVTGSGATAVQNTTDSQANAVMYVANPAGAVGSSLNLYPKNNSALKATPVDLNGLDGFPDWNRDFNGTARADATYRGAYYGGEGVNPGWLLALDFKP